MIINGGSRSNGRYFAGHLMRADENERVQVVEMRGLAADTLPEAFREMHGLASAECKNYFYHANLNTRVDEHLTPEQWDHAVDALEHELNLDGHARFVVEHEKDGRTHRHVVWSRIDPDTLTATSDSNNYAAHERAARALEVEFGHEAVRGVHAERDGKARPERRPKAWETFRGHESGIDPQAVKAEITALWQASDSGQAFRAALEERGYLLCKGDRRDFCVIDQAGDEHSLARRIQGAKAADIRARLADFDRDTLPGVAEARLLARQAPEVEASHEATFAPETVAKPPTAERNTGGAQDTRSKFDRIADLMDAALCDNRGEPVAHDGPGHWTRTVIRLASLRQDVARIAGRVTDWALERWQEYVARDEPTRHPDRDDHQRER